MIIENTGLHQVRSEVGDASVALRFGTYDLLHEGHREGLEFAADQADFLVVGILPDERIRLQKGITRPIIPQDFRAATIDSLPIVDYTFIAPPQARNFPGIFRSLRPDVYVEHAEYKTGPLKKAFLRSMGVELVIDRGEKIHSTTKMIGELGVESAKASSAQMARNLALTLPRH